MNQLPLRVSPHDRVAEQSILGVCLMEASTIHGARASGISPQDFYFETHGTIYQAMLDLVEIGEPPIELLSVINTLKSMGALEKVGGAAYISELGDAQATTANIKHYCKIVINHARLRQLIKLSDDISGRAHAQGAKIEEIIVPALERLNIIGANGTASGKITSAQDLLNTTFREDVPAIAGGILPHGGGLIIAGESGAGKSILRLEMAIHLAMGWNLWGGELEVPTARRVLIIQFENSMSTEKYRLRKMMDALSIDHYPDIQFAENRLRVDLRLKKDRPKLQQIVEESRAQVVVYDPLASMHTANENDNIQMRDVLDTMTQINREARCACILIHHFGKPDPEFPSRARYRGATSIKDWCDTLISYKIKSHETRILRSLEFDKVREGRGRAPLLLERGEDFLHRPTDEDTLCTTGGVFNLLRRVGSVDGQADLIKMLMDDFGCGNRTARESIYRAVRHGYIREITIGRIKRYEAKE